MHIGLHAVMHPCTVLYQHVLQSCMMVGLKVIQTCSTQ
jgi:hypothetical protein